jgi:hypothetical protein
MTKRFRRFIFLVFTVFFIITSIIIASYAQGYRFDFNSWKIVKTGGIFIKTSITDVKIYIDDKYIESTGGILNYSSLVSGLTPKYYNAFIYKEGYYPWNKSIEVKDGMVTEMKNILLFPIELVKTKVAELPSQTISKFSVKDNIVIITNAAAKTVKTYDFQKGLLSTDKLKPPATTTEDILSPDGEKRLYAALNQLWIEYLKNVDIEPVKSAGEKELVAEYETPLNFFDWLSDSEHIVWFGNNELNIAERDNRGGKRNVVKYYLNINSPVFFDRDSAEFYFFENSLGKEILYKFNILGK